jgi:hypothetical protein
MGLVEKTRSGNRRRGEVYVNRRRVRMAGTTASEGTHIGLD